jgi:tRNA(Ile)-lysidine synthase
MAAPEHTLILQTESLINTHDMVPPGAAILAAVSGGADSIALLHVLLELGYSVHVAHFDHQTRNGQSSLDAQWVREITAALEIPFYLGTADIPGMAEQSPHSFEEMARRERYSFFAETAHEKGCQAIATGHHQDDQAETILMRLVRGTSLHGLGGIPPMRNEDNIPIIRPLLQCTKIEIMDYIESRQLDYLEDESNQDTEFLRNRVRHELIPTLRADYNSHVSHHLSQLAEIAQLENDFMDSLLDAFRSRCMQSDTLLNRHAFRTGHCAMQRRLVHDWAVEKGVLPDYRHIADAVQFIIDAPAGKNFDLGHFGQLSNGKDLTAFVITKTNDDSAHIVPISIPGETLLMGQRFRISTLPIRPEDEIKDQCSPQHQLVNTRCLEGDVKIRTRKNGDRFQPFGMKGTRKLKDYFSDLGIPPAIRGSIPLITVDDEIIWIVGHAISARAALMPDDSDAFKIEVFYAAAG